MKLELLQKAIEEEKNVFSEVNNVAYSLEPVSEERLVEIAKDVNEQLGYELYDKLDRVSLVADFSTTSKTLYKGSLEEINKEVKVEVPEEAKKALEKKA